MKIEGEVVRRRYSFLIKFPFSALSTARRFGLSIHAIIRNHMQSRCNQGMHLLLQSTDIVWAIILAEYVNGEDLGVVEILAAFLSGTGSFLIGLHAVDTLEMPLMSILVTLRDVMIFCAFYALFAPHTIPYFHNTFWNVVADVHRCV